MIEHWKTTHEIAVVHFHVLGFGESTLQMQSNTVSQAKESMNIAVINRKAKHQYMYSNGMPIQMNCVILMHHILRIDLWVISIYGNLYNTLVYTPKGVHQYRYFLSSMRTRILLLSTHAYILIHEHTTKELVYSLRRGSTCIGVRPFDV